MSQDQGQGEMEDNFLVHGEAVLEEDYDRADLFSSQLERKLRSIVCGQCGASSPDLQSWRSHCVTSHPTLPAFSPAKLPTGLSPAPELFRASPGRAVECGECGRMFSSLEEMREHAVSQMRSVRLVCPQCGAHWADLESHLLSDHAQDTTCAICNLQTEDILGHHHNNHQGFPSVIVETEVRCAGDGVTVEYFETVLSTQARFLATEVKPEASVKQEFPLIPEEVEAGPKIIQVSGSYPQSQGRISNEAERNSYNMMCYQKLHSQPHTWRMGLSRNCCEICGFAPYTKNKYREKQDHLAKLHFKERIDDLLPFGSPYLCPAPQCQYRGKDKQDIQRHYTGKHNILKMWVESFLKQQEGLLASSQQNKLKTSGLGGLGGTTSEWEMSFREMELIAIQQEENRGRAGEEKKQSSDNISDSDIEVDISNSSLSISKISTLERTVAPVIETPPSISLIRIQNKESTPKGDLTSSASILLQSLAAQKSPFSIVQSRQR